MKILPALAALSMAAVSANAAEKRTTGGTSEPDKVEMRLVDKVPEGADKDDVIICKNVSDVGTKIPRRLCRTMTQWDRISAENEEALRNNQRSSGRKAAADGIDRSS